MKKTVVTAFYRRPCRVLPIKFQSSRKVNFGEDTIVEFDFSGERVLCLNATTQKEIAKLIAENRPSNSISGFMGMIAGTHFKLMISRGWFLGSPIITLSIDEKEGGMVQEIKFECVHLQREFRFWNLTTCHYLGEEKIEVIYDEAAEEMAQVIGAVLLSLLLDGANTRGAQ